MSQVPATQADMQFANTGLEDFAVTDAVLPRLKIIQSKGLWEDNLTRTQFPVLRFIALGLVKQRVLFHHNVEDNDVPMCKSSDFNLGFPNAEAPAKKSFPWELSGFDPNDFPADASGTVKLPCDGCQLKEWGSNPTSEAPYCAEQWTMPIYYDTSQDGSGDWSPAILTLQKSNIKPIKSYLTSFAHSNKPPFISVGEGTLEVRRRGSVEYSVATFQKREESPRDRWMEFSEQYADMRKFLTRPPVTETDGEPVAQDNTNRAPQQQAAPVQQQVQQTAQQPQDPWVPSNTVQPQEPPAVQPEVPTQPVAPQQTPPPPPAPVQQQPVAPQQPTQQVPPPPAGQGLPF